MHIRNGWKLRCTAPKTIEVLRSIFATHGLPRTIVSDNGPTFTSHEFSVFVRRNIIHIRSSPYHPSTNGLAERAVRTFKLALRCSSNGRILENLDRFLFHYRITPHTTTGVPPAELLMGRSLRSRLNFLFSDVHGKVEASQLEQKRAHDGCHSLRIFSVGDKVLIKDFTQSTVKWLPGTICKISGPLSYIVDGRMARRHVDHIRRRHFESTKHTPIDGGDLYLPADNTDMVSPSLSSSSISVPPVDRQLRRSSRIRRPPIRYGVV